MQQVMLGKQQVNPSPFNYFSFENFSVEGVSDKKVMLNRNFFKVSIHQAQIS